jgi:hypothetical protein
MRLSENLKKGCSALVLAGFVLVVGGCAQQTSTPPTAPPAGGSKTTTDSGPTASEEHAGSGDATGAAGAAPADEKAEAKPEGTE